PGAGGAGRGGGGSSVSVGGTVAGGPADVRLADLEARLGQLVRVSGRVEALAVEALMLDDDSARAQVLLEAGFEGLAGTLRIGDLLNVVGYARRGPDDDPVIEPRTPGDVTVAPGLLVPAAAQVGASASSRPGASIGAADARGRTAPPQASDTLGLLSLCLSVLLAGAAALTLLVRGPRIERLFSAAIRVTGLGQLRMPRQAASEAPSDGPPDSVG
ncbi:MAG: hypothetical protein ACRDGL_04825, partial [Candidatus Limnocylindrales bacterium]